MLPLLSAKAFSFSPVSQTLLVVAAGLLLVLLVVHVYAERRTGVERGDETSRKRKRLLTALRLTAVLCVLLALLRPVLSLEADESHKPEVFVLLDASASMNMPRVPSAAADSVPSRADVALGAARELLESLDGRYETSVFSFTDSLRELTGELEIYEARPDGVRSALGSALEQLASRVRTSAAAAILISDGSSSFGPDPSAVAKRLRLPVYTVAVAGEGPIRDIEITDVLHPASGYERTEAPVVVRVKGQGLENLETPVNITEGKSIVSRGMLKLAGSAETEVLLTVKPRSAGVHFYRVDVPAVEGEASVANNSWTFPLRVTSEKLRILYIQGDLSWDFTFLKRLLESDVRLDNTFALVSDSKAALPAGSSFVAPSSRQLEETSVVILDGGAAGRVGAEMWNALENFVDSGGGLLVIGTAALDKLPNVARRLLPARVRRSGNWGPPEHLKCQVTFAGLNHAICDVEREAFSSRDSWKGVSPLVGSHVLEEAKEGSDVLVEAVNGQERFPIVVVGQYGRGRVVLIAASGLWRWGFTLPALGGSDKLFQRFMSNAVWWLSESEEESLQDVIPRSWVFQSGEEVVFSTRRGGERLNLEVTDETGGLLTPVETEPGVADTSSVSFGALGPGTYDYRAFFGEESRSAAFQGKFVVDTTGPEHRSLFPDPGLLAYVSEASGGRAFTAEEAGELAAEIEAFGREAKVEKQIRLWNHPLLFVIFAASIALEWWLRRRSGLP